MNARALFVGKQSNLFVRCLAAIHRKYTLANLQQSTRRRLREGMSLLQTLCFRRLATPPKPFTFLIYHLSDGLSTFYKSTRDILQVYYFNVIS